MSLCLNTFSIVARCPRTGQLGVAVSTAIPAVGGLCSYIRPGVAAISTQSFVNPYLAIDALDRAGRGDSPEAALEFALAQDDDTGVRQIGMVDARGRAHAWTGDACTPWAGQILGPGMAVQGNMLTGGATLDAMAESFEKGADQDLADRLVESLVAGQGAGGDMRGKQSASVQVFGAEAFALVDLRVDDDPDPVARLARLHARAKVQLYPFVASMPRRHGDAIPLSERDREVIMASPDARPDPGSDQ